MKHNISINLNANSFGCELHVVIDDVSFSASCKDVSKYGRLGQELSWTISAMFPMATTKDMAENLDLIELQDAIIKTMYQLERLFCKEKKSTQRGGNRN